MGKFLKKAGKAAEFLTNRDYRLMVLGEYHVFGKAWLPDDEFLKVKFQRAMGYPLDLEHPRTFNEKLQWLKLYDRRPEYTIMVDKYAAKQYVADRIGSEYVIPTFGVWDRFDDIDFDALPNQFVLKCTHDCGGQIICRDKAKLDREAARRKLTKCLRRNYYWSGREWPYKNVPPRILAEKYMEDTETGELRDYKFYTFNGVIKALLIACDRQDENQELKMDFFDADFRHLPIKKGHPNADIPLKKPETFELMKELAEKLADGIPEVRADFYEVNGRAYFGELTFSPASGFEKFEPSEWDRKFGEWIQLPENVKKGGGSH